MKNLNAKRKGFTLIELVVVVTIIGVLLVLLVPRFVNMSDGARVTTFQSQARSIYSAMNMHSVEKGTVPESFADLAEYLNEVQLAIDNGDDPEEALFNKPIGAQYVFTDAGEMEATLYEPQTGGGFGDAFEPWDDDNKTGFNEKLVENPIIYIVSAPNP